MTIKLMSTPKKPLGIAAIMLSATILAGCGTSSTTPNKVATTPHTGGTVVVALPPATAINWYQPIIGVPYNSLYNVWASHLMYKSLFHINRTGTINYAKSIASKISWNTSGTVYTVNLHHKWRWSNGSPVTASDVAFAWQVIKAASSSQAVAPWPFIDAGSGGIPNLVKSVVVDNPYKLTVTLNQPTNQQWFVYHGLSDLTPLPKQSWDIYPTSIVKEISYLGSTGNQAGFFKVIDGPFRLSHVTFNQSWTFVPNTRYNGHKPYINKLIFAYETGDAAEFTSLLQGTTQVGYLPFSMYGSLAQLKNDQMVASPTYDVYRTILTYKNPQYASIFQQLPVREALQMSINQPAIIASIYHGLAKPGIGPVPVYPSTYMAPQLSKPVYPYNPQQAIALLKAHGWHEIGGVMTNHQGQRLSFSLIYPSGSTTSQDVVEIVQSDWKKIGVQVSLKSMPFLNILGLHHQYSAWNMMTGLAWNYSQPYPTGGGMYGTGGGYNFFGYSSNTMNTLIAATHAPQPTNQAAQQALDRYQVFVAKQVPTLFMPVPDQLNVYAKTVHGVKTTNNIITQLIYPQYWWVQ